MTQSLVVGVDAGATSTRVAVHALDGTRVGYARAGAGNPSAHGVARAVASVGEALAAALPPDGGPRVVASMAGVAGYVAEMVPELNRLWAAHGIADGPRYGGDVPMAYAAGSAEPEGSLLLSGTGAGAARIVGFELDQVADALGWLLGDVGSGFWIGRQAAKAVIDALDRGMPLSSLLPDEPAGTLASLVGRHFLGAERPATPRAAAARIVRLAQADHMRLAALSTLVNEAATAGDPLAVKISQEAADHLVATLRRVHVSGPVVLAGSVLTSDGPVREAVLELLSGETVTRARDAAGAAAWLSARPLLPSSEARALHPAFTAGA
ncbi:N-acetylglucosamine kinase-like BadF-type ATPase [Nonomuraea thailandensis]|uniref:N-acetylglucosamine kinase-like BadF-type ATPase n=1 Tax=Nonomuraea thailandensis TaxID=1188745 RepID=A0A9X2K8P0_9ACTN|nr:BadF/BadG/BcrA/BcrD ATPase family protein [Nonomuraea thailandensis]MCP2361001.1 N-acetylglucosamine kinase-like BadF-type ATPase [Nonomuraea thailandensis]